MPSLGPLAYSVTARGADLGFVSYMIKRFPLSFLVHRLALLAMAFYFASLPGGSALGAVGGLSGAASTAPRSFAELRAAAEKGDMVAQRLLANAYLNGEGVAQDNPEAVRWLRSAAEQRDAAAQYVLGILYDEGRGVPRDLREAVKWYEQAALQGLPDAQFNLALCYAKGEGVPKDSKRAAEWLTKAAKSGDAQAQSRLGLAYITGNGVERNPVEAASWLRKAAYPPAEEPKAQFFLGRLFQEGEGVERDVATAARWFRKAAAQGYADAQFHLGRLLISGEGGEQNPAEGRSLIEKAATQRHEAATQYLAQGTQGSPTSPNPVSSQPPGGLEPSPMKAAAMRTMHSTSNTLPSSPAGTFSPPVPESSPSFSLGSASRDPLPAVPALPAPADASNRPPEKATSFSPPGKTASFNPAAKEPGLPPFTPEPASKAPPTTSSPNDIFTVPSATKAADPLGQHTEPPRMLPTTTPEPAPRMENFAPSNRPVAPDNNSGLMAIAAISTGISALILILGVYVAVVFKARLHGLESELKKAQFELSKANVNLSSMMHQVEQLSLMAPQTPTKTSLPEWNAEAPKAHTASFKMNRSK